MGESIPRLEGREFFVPRGGEGIDSVGCAEESASEEAECGVGSILTTPEIAHSFGGWCGGEEGVVGSLEGGDDVAVGGEGLGWEEGSGEEGLGDGGMEADEEDGGLAVFLPSSEEESLEEAVGGERGVEAAGIRVGLTAEAEGVFFAAFGVVEVKVSAEQGAFEATAAGGLFFGILPDP